MIQQHQQSRRQLTKKDKVIIGVSFSGCITWLILGITLPFFVTWIISKEAESQLPLKPQNQFLWAHLPGSTNTIIRRNFTFFNFTNPKEVIYRGDRPVFHEIGGYSYIEKQDYLNLTYVNEGREAKFNFRLHFDKADESRNVDQKVTFLNFVPMGLWYQVKAADLSTFCQQGLALVTFALRDTFKDIVVSTGVSTLFLGNFTSYQLLAEAADLSSDLQRATWQDPIFGVSSHISNWIAASLNRTGDDYRILKRYFAMQAQSLDRLLDTIGQWAQFLSKAVDNWYCPELGQCTNDHLTTLQFSQSAVTSSPPPGVDASISFCSMNVTCTGYPEISSYLKNVFPLEYPNKSNLTTLTFSQELMTKWLIPTKTTYSLLHVTNMQYLWQVGQRYDQNRNNSELGLLTDRFELQSDEHSFVFWSWMKYFTKEFLMKFSLNGTRQTLAIGGGGANGLFTGFAAAQDWLEEELLGAKVSAKIRKVGCQQYLKDIVGDITQQQVDSICSFLNLTSSNFSAVINFTRVCQYEFGEEWQNFSKLYKFTDMQMLQLCDVDSLHKTIRESEQQIYDHYGCQITKFKRCSGFQLALKQWNNSQISLMPIQEVSWPRTLTLKDINKDLYTYELEHYFDFVRKPNIPRPSLEQMIKLLSFDYLFSGTRLQDMMLEKNDTKFRELYFWEQPATLKSYMKYILLQIPFNGYTMQRSPQELLFGYEDDFLKQLKETDPAMGGDPSLNVIAALNEANVTEEDAHLYPQSVETGVGQLNRTRAFKTINGKSTINMNYSYWNGYEVLNDTKSPWMFADPLDGTDGSRSYPGLKEDPNANNISIYIPAVYRIGLAKYNTTIKKYGMDVLDTRISPEVFMNEHDNPDNKRYYMGYSCFLNITPISFAPFFVSKNHFYDCPKNWSELVDIYDESGKHRIEASFWDDTYLHIEPITGISFAATIYLQTNYLYEQDELFEQPGTKMFPMFTLYRSANVSETVVNDYFYLIKLALQVKKLALYISIFLAGLMLLIGLGFYLKSKKIVEFEQTESLIEPEKRRDQLMISLQVQKSKGDSSSEKALESQEESA